MSEPAVYYWHELRDRAVQRFGRRIPATTEAALLPIFHEHPAELAAVLEAIGDDIEAGTVRSGWAVVRQRVAASLAVATADARALENALRWARTVGQEYEREDEVDDECFGTGGLFRARPDMRPVVLEEWRRCRAA